MSFLSPAFALLVLASVLVFRLAPARMRRHVLLAASVLFYAAVDPWHLLLLLALSAAVHRVAMAVSDGAAVRQKLRLTAVAVTALVLVMFGFKAIEGMLEGFRASPAGAQAFVLLVAPLGLSYYLFRLIGYLLDVYWGRLAPERSFSSLLLFAAFFPQIVSGPIARAGDFFDQTRELGKPPAEMISSGLRRILFGLVKKVAVADRLADLVASLFADPTRYSSLELLVGAYAFAIQLYMDFSGLTDMAIGVGQLFGVKGPENFDLPFWAPNLQEFWRRWHMSLTSWLRDYFFTPLRLNLRRFGNLGLSVALFLNMVAVGLWHGLLGTYLAFGALHGAMLTASVLSLKRRNQFFLRYPALAKVRVVAGPLITFHLVALALVFFRASSLSQALSYFSRLLFQHGEAAATRLTFARSGRTALSVLLVFALALGVDGLTWASRSPRLSRWFLQAPVPLRWAVYYGGALALLLYGNVAAQKFIYAQF